MHYYDDPLQREIDDQYLEEAKPKWPLKFDGSTKLPLITQHYLDFRNPPSVFWDSNPTAVKHPRVLKAKTPVDVSTSSRYTLLVPTDVLSQPNRKTMNLSVELWVRVFQHIGPEAGGYARKIVVEQLAANTTTFRGSGGSDVVDEFGRLVPQIPKFEANLWMHTRRFYTINRNSRAAALMLGLSLEFLKLAKRPLCSLPRPKYVLGKKPGDPWTWVDPWASRPQDRPKCLVWELFNPGYFDKVEDLRELMIDDGVQFIPGISPGYYRWDSQPGPMGCVKEMMQEAVEDLLERFKLLYGVKSVILLAGLPNSASACPPAPVMKFLPAFFEAWKRAESEPGDVFVYD